MTESNREEIAKLEALYAGNPAGRVFVHLAEAYRKAGEHERARRILDEGLGRHPDSASGHVVLGRVLADMQITGEAETAFRRVLQLDGGNLVALRWLGDLARQAGRNAEAAAHYRELLVRNPSNEEVRDLVEIVEREAISPAPHARDADERDGREEANASADWSTEARDDPAVSEPERETEEPAVGPLAGQDRPADRDIPPWGAAPGQTGETETPDVDFGLVEIDRDASETDVHPQAAVSPHGAGGSFGALDLDDESDVVASFDDDDSGLLELDELRRDDEAEPVEIHLLDPSFEPRDDADEYVGELDLSDLEAASAVEDEEDYADDSFIADLSLAGQEEPPEDELPAGVDLMNAGSALTLLPDEEDEGPDDEHRPDAAGSEREAALDHSEATADHEPVGYLDFTESDELDDEAEPAFSAGSEDSEFGFAAPVSGEYLQDDDDDDWDVVPDDGSGDRGSDAPLETSAGLVEEFGAGLFEESGAGLFEESGAGLIEESDAGLIDEFDAGLIEESVADRIAAMEEAAAEPAAEAELVSEVRRETDVGLVTETMALLYRSQGFHERAADVYRALLRARPDDERLLARLREVEAAAAPGTGSAAGDEAAEDAGEVWLRGVATAWTAAKDSPVDDATPYAWTEDADEAETGEPIGSYLSELVAWKAGTRRWMEQQGEQEPEADQAGDGIELPDWMNDPAGSGVWTPDSEPAGFEPVAEADAGWSPAETVVDPDPWAVPDEPADAAPALESQQVTGDPVEGTAPAASAAEALSPPAEDPFLAPDAASGPDAGWTPLDLDRDQPSSAVMEPLPPLPPLAEAAGQEEDSAEDEDLEMFRTWLQSLKK